MTYETAEKAERAVVASITARTPCKNRGAYPGNPALTGSAEISRLTESAGAEVIHEEEISIARVDPGYYIGKGKVMEIAAAVEEKSANLVVFDCSLSPSQQGKLEKALGARVVDRTQVILDIFARRARTNEGKLQVELARLNYALPRLAGSGAEMSRLGGGIGTRGPGEMKIETDRRRIKKRINTLNREIGRIRNRRALGRKERGKLANIALAGYTNSGKSTLLNTLAGSSERSEDMLFSTLDAAVRRLNLPGKVPAVMIDTVGFIRELPHDLIAAFKATLEEITAADILLRVIDASEPSCEERFQTVTEIIGELGAAGKPYETALNKIDLIGEKDREKLQNIFPEAIPVSAKTGEGMDRLSGALSAKASALRRRVILRIPQSLPRLVAGLHREASVLNIRYGGKDILVEAEISDELHGKIQNYIERTGGDENQGGGYNTEE